MTGPLLGNARAGWMASLRSVRFSIVTGGVVCVAGVLLCIPLLPASGGTSPIVPARGSPDTAAHRIARPARRRRLPAESGIVRFNG